MLFDPGDYARQESTDTPSQDRPESSDEPLDVALSDLMSRQRLTQSELARRAGVSQTHVSRLVNGQSRASAATIGALAGALRVAPAYFFDYRLEVAMRVIERSPPLLNELFEQSLSPAERRAWKSLARSDQGLGRTLSALSGQRGVTLGEVAEDAELAPGYLEHLVARNGVVRSAEVLEALARTLDVLPEYFLEYRSALLREWLREDPPRLDALFEELCSASNGSRAPSVAAQITLDPHVA